MSVDTRLAKAVAASSCFPGVFSPLKMCVGGTTASRFAGHWYERSRVPYSIRLIDGGPAIGVWPDSSRALSNKESARHLQLSESTIKHHVHSILAKSGLSRGQVMQQIRDDPWSMANREQSAA